MRIVVKKRIADARRVTLARRKYKGGVFTTLERFFRLMLRELFSPDEILMLGLLDPKKTRHDLTRFVSKEKMLRLQIKLNPSTRVYLTEDKFAFYSHCCTHNLATPRVYAIFPGRDSMREGVLHIREHSEWLNFCRGLTDPQIVLKPVGGTHGEGVLILEKVHTGFRDVRGNVYNASDLLSFMQGTSYKEWLVQERLQCHSALRDLSNVTSLQTARVVTYVNNNEEASVIAAWLRIIGESSSTDNFNFGESGNLVGSVDLETGRIETAVGMGSDKLGIVDIEKHPVTGVRLLEFQIPDWDRVLELVKRAALCFRPLRTIGWDVAITDRRPSLIEGNVNWDPLPGHHALKDIYEMLRKDSESLKTPY